MYLWVDICEGATREAISFRLESSLRTMSQTAADSSSSTRDKARSELCEDRVEIDKSDQRVRRMFASIAQRYDLLNHLLSLNIDRSWRRFTTRKVPPHPEFRCSIAAPARRTSPWPTTAPRRASRASSVPTFAVRCSCSARARSGSMEQPAAWS